MSCILKNIAGSTLQVVYEDLSNYLLRSARSDPDYETDVENVDKADHVVDDDEIFEVQTKLQPNVNICKQNTFLVFESNLLKLMKYCAQCGSVIDSSKTKEVKNTGSQLTLRFFCEKGRSVNLST